jgi:cyclophilin family peptidyl-prolyl cis-trans isomerase
MKKLVVAVALLSVLSCGKKESIPVTKENVREVLTQYGKDNTETEVEITTQHGIIRLKLFTDTPLHRANFIKQIKEGYYDNADFYRIVYEFMIQGGDMSKSLPYRVPSEFRPDFYHKKGALAMARVSDNNPDMESSSTEFYIIQGRKYADYEIDEEARNAGIMLTPEQKQVYQTLGGDMSLDQKYTVFGEVISGLDVVDVIAKSKTYNERPNQKIPFEIKVVDPIE